MPFSYQYLDGGIGIRTVAIGDISFDDIMRIRKKIFPTEQKIKQLKYGLYDFNDSRPIDLSPETLRTISQDDVSIANINPNLIIAVIHDTEMGYGLGRMWEMMIDESKWETMIFRSMNEAKTWIKERVLQVHSINVTFTN